MSQTLNHLVPAALPSAPAIWAESHHHVAAQLIAEPPRGSHAVQFYDDDAFLFDTVGQFLGAGLRAGDRLLVIASADHVTGILEALGAEADGALASGQLTLIDASALLAEFMQGGMPEPARFRDALARVIALTESYPGPRLRAFGEMVDMLWRDGNTRAAVRLEELWNEAGKAHEFSLLCAYTMGNFHGENDGEQFLEVCRQHSHVMPTESISKLDDAEARLREISMLQQRARRLESEIHGRKELEHALRDSLEQRGRVEAELRASLEREQAAGVKVAQSDAFKEMFMSLLGHDLRNPLNIILTTTRLMALRGELGADTQKRLDRVIASGVRMQRMIEQILDIARDRLTTGISVTRTAARDLAPLVSKIVEETHLSHPNHSVEMHVRCCTASVDADRFEQVVSNLLRNAVAHGDPEQPIVVTLAEHGGRATFSVHNYGPPIDPEHLPVLFDPFRRVRKPEGCSEGLGLGLYISARILAAHGGTLTVKSSEAAGTLFEASFPRDP